jgi:hypothetical protein
MDARPRFAAATLTALFTALAMATPAGAAYAPQFSFTVDPATPDTAATITSTITQASGETASKTVSVTIPAGFSPNLPILGSIGKCPAEQDASIPCPGNSQIGTATTTVESFGQVFNLAGTAFYGGPSPTNALAQQLLIVLPDTPVGPMKLLGTATPLPDASIQTVFDNLPNFLTTAFTLKLDGATSLLKTPVKCGTYNVTAAFTSQTGETATGTSPVNITGCTAGGPPSTGPTSPTSPGSPTATAVKVGAPRLARTGVVTFKLSAPAKVTVTVTRAGHRVARKKVAGKKGINRVKVGRKVRSGRYVVSIVAVDASGNTVRKRANVRVR